MAVSKPPILQNGHKIAKNIVVKGLKNTDCEKYKIAGKIG